MKLFAPNNYLIILIATLICATSYAKSLPKRNHQMVSLDMLESVVISITIQTIDSGQLTATRPDCPPCELPVFHYDSNTKLLDKNELEHPLTEIRNWHKANVILLYEKPTNRVISIQTNHPESEGE